MNIRPALFVIAVWLVAVANATAQDRKFLDNVLVSKTNGVTTVQLWPACPVRYIDHQPDQSGSELRLQIVTTSACELDGELDVNERYSDDSLRLAKVTDIDVQSWRSGELYITLRFSEPASFEIRQRGVGWIEVDVDTRVDASTLAATRPPPLDATPPAAPTPDTLPSLDELRAREPTRPPSTAGRRRIRAEVSDAGDFVVQLGVFSDASPVLSRLRSLKIAEHAFSRDIRLNDTVWQGLHLGFFESYALAEDTLAQLHADFPDAFVRRLHDGDRLAAEDAARDARQPLLPPAIVASREPSSDPAMLQSLLDSGRDALLQRDEQLAIQQLSELLAYPGHAWRNEARELLAVALERSGQTERAMAEYHAFLLDADDPASIARVQARLDGLEIVQSLTPALAANTRSTEPSAWSFQGGISHYYWRNQEQRVEDGNYLVSSSGAVGLLNATARRTGERWAWLLRLNGSYQHNFVEFDRRGDTGFVSAAFVEATDRLLGVRVRAGRQNNRRFGVLDRFDGATVDWQFLPGYSAGISAGLPVDSPRFIGDSNRQFVAGRAAADELLDGKLSVSVFTHQQTASGLIDRQAIGGEALYRDGAYSVFSLLDYDASFGVLNTALLNVNWRLENGWTVTSRVQAGARPYLTTRNALTGQTATSLAVLEQSFSEGQIRRLARDRTAENQSLALGLSIPVNDRTDLSVDLTLNNTDATLASGGVASIPATGTEVFAIASLVTTNVFGANDLLRISSQYQRSDWRESAYLILDGRFAFGRRLRLTAGLTAETHERRLSGESQRVLEPSLRVQYRLRTLLFDVEVGGRWSDRELPPFELNPFVTDGSELLYGGYINAGYRWEF